MHSKKKHLEVCYSPGLFPLYDSNESIVVVIDVLRATSSICVAFENGAEEIVPVSQVEDCLEYKKKGYLIAGERNGEMLPGFDFGNSPFSYMGPGVRGKSIAITTTNGTQAIHAARNAPRVVIGSFLNLETLRSWLEKQERSILFLCAGWKNKFNLEDTLLAGAFCEQLFATGKFNIDCDCAISAMHLYGLGKNDLFGFLANSSHRKRLERLKIEKDIEFCLMHNLTKVIPVLEGEALRNLKSGVSSHLAESRPA